MNEAAKALAQPLRIGKMTAKNRIWLSPLWTRTASTDGEAVDRVIEHYRARAKGGAGLITQEGTAVDENHVWVEPQISIANDKYLPGLSRVVEAVHCYNTPIICQLHHAGMYGTDPVSPSGVACYSIGLRHFIQPRVLMLEEIEEIRDKFIAAALRAHEVGYDGVELHGGTAYLLEQFFSPHNNKRVDKYGGNVMNRMRLAVEILQGIRKALGPDFVVGYTGIDSDLIEDGIHREDNLVLAKTLEQEGLSYFDLQTSGTYETFHLEEAPGGTARSQHGQFDMVEIYKKELHIPVITRAAAENDPDKWNEAVEKGQTDAVRVGRMMLSDPDVANKVLKGRKEDIRGCLRCGNCHVTGVIVAKNLSCTVNPGMGRGEAPLLPAARAKKVAVVGGGPAGLEAARICAERGHSVTLFEKQGQTGGNQYIGSLPVAKGDLMNFIHWAEGQCKKLGVDIRLNTEATAEQLGALAPDTVFLATGSTPVRPPIPGIDGKNVVLAEQVLLGSARVGENVVVLGGGEVGLETADLLLEKDMAKHVSVVEMLPDVGIDMSLMDKGALFGGIFPAFMGQGRFAIYTNTRAIGISDEGVQVMTTAGEKKLAADTVVLALGYRANNALYEQMAEGEAEVYVIGDAAAPRRIIDAIQQANEIARYV